VSYTSRVTRRRRLWVWVFGGFCLLALGLGCLARPVDEYAGLRALHPREEVTSPSGVEGYSAVRSFQFDVAPVAVRQRLPKFGRTVTGVVSTGNGMFASGNEFFFVQPLSINPRFPESTCIIQVYETRPGPWHEVAWRTLKMRLGI
jgi:hypothetical protein